MLVKSWEWRIPERWTSYLGLLCFLAYGVDLLLVSRGIRRRHGSPRAVRAGDKAVFGRTLSRSALPCHSRFYGDSCGRHAHGGNRLFHRVCHLCAGRDRQLHLPGNPPLGGNQRPHRTERHHSRTALPGALPCPGRHHHRSGCRSCLDRNFDFLCPAAHLERIPQSTVTAKRSDDGVRRPHFSWANRPHSTILRCGDACEVRWPAPVGTPFARRSADGLRWAKLDGHAAYRNPGVRVSQTFLFPVPSARPARAAQLCRGPQCKAGAIPHQSWNRSAATSCLSFPRREPCLATCGRCMRISITRWNRLTATGCFPTTPASPISPRPIPTISENARRNSARHAGAVPGTAATPRPAHCQPCR